jgi:hypothetical protein
MTGGGFVAVMSAIVTVALVSVAVSHTETANIIKAFGGAFAGSISAAKS